MTTLAELESVRQALGRLPYGLYFLVVGDPAHPRGMLVSWVGQVSGDPPLLLAAVRHNRSIAPALTIGAAFGLNLLSEGDRDLLARLAQPERLRFTGLELDPGPLGLPRLAGGLGMIACRVEEIRQPGDHLLCLGRVVEVAGLRPGAVLTTAAGGHPYLGLS